MKLDKLKAKANPAPLMERRKDERVQIMARISKEKKQKMDALNISVQKMVDEMLDSYIEQYIERIKNYEV